MLIGARVPEPQVSRLQAPVLQPYPKLSSTDPTSISYLAVTVAPPLAVSEPFAVAETLIVYVFAIVLTVSISYP